MRKNFALQSIECRAILVPEDGGFYVYASRLPGVCSQGENEKEAIANIVEAFRGAIQEYLDSGSEIPWQENWFERPAGAIERWMLVNV